MVELATLQVVFLVAVTVSAALAVVVFAIYQRQKQNVLVRLACLIVVALDIVLIVSLFFTSRELQDDALLHEALAAAEDSDASLADVWESYIQARFPNYDTPVAERGLPEMLRASQAFVVHYLALVFHALLSSSLINSVCLGFGYPETAWNRLLIMLFASLSLSAVPLYVLLIQGLASVVILPGYFHPYIHSPQYAPWNLCVLLLGLPGVAAGFYLIIRTLAMRRKSRNYWKTFSQITPFYILRLLLCNLVFFLLVAAGTVPSRELTVCLMPTYGLVIFLMYGFGAPARKFYRELRDSLMQKRPAPNHDEHDIIGMSIPYPLSQPSLSHHDSTSSRSSIDRSTPIPIPDVPVLNSSYFGSPATSDANRRSSAPSEVARKYTEFFSGRTNSSPRIQSPMANTRPPQPPSSPARSTSSTSASVSSSGSPRSLRSPIPIYYHPAERYLERLGEEDETE